MYDQIEKYAAEFDNLRALLADPDAASNIASICKALEETAQRLADHQAQNENDRATLTKIYRGFLAASRVVAHLQERRAMCR